MIYFDFDYYRPDSLKEAADTFQYLSGQGRNVIWYAGGTEIISGARMNRIRFDAVIDIKTIPECNQFGFRDDKLVIGAAVPLTRVSDSGVFPLLGLHCRRSADHTARDKITLGGNICGRTPYREAVLPLLLSECEVVIAGVDTVKTLPIKQAFNRELQLGKGEFLTQIIIDKRSTNMAYASVRKTKQEKMDYPLVTVTAAAADGRIRAAFSGLCSYPFRLSVIEEDLNNNTIAMEERIDRAIGHLPEPIAGDLLGSAEYREFVARNALRETLEGLGGI